MEGKMTKGIKKEPKKERGESGRENIVIFSLIYIEKTQAVNGVKT